MPQRTTLSPLFPYPTLLRSGRVGARGARRAQRAGAVRVGRVARHRRPAPSEHVAGRVPGPEHARGRLRSEEHTSELQSRENLVCRLLLEKKKKTKEVEL